jgi:hypothetical protein
MIASLKEPSVEERCTWGPATQLAWLEEKFFVSSAAILNQTQFALLKARRSAPLEGFSPLYF